MHCVLEDLIQPFILGLLKLLLYVIVALAIVHVGVNALFTKKINTLNSFTQIRLVFHEFSGTMLLQRS